jgi:hypothetical protein
LRTLCPPSRTLCPARWLAVCGYCHERSFAEPRRPHAASAARLHGPLSQPPLLGLWSTGLVPGSHRRPAAWALPRFFEPTSGLELYSPRRSGSLSACSRPAIPDLALRLAASPAPTDMDPPACSHHRQQPPCHRRTHEMERDGSRYREEACIEAFSGGPKQREAGMSQKIDRAEPTSWREPARNSLRNGCLHRMMQKGNTQCPKATWPSRQPAIRARSTWRPMPPALPLRCTCGYRRRRRAPGRLPQDACVRRVAGPCSDRAAWLDSQRALSRRRT